MEKCNTSKCTGSSRIISIAGSSRAAAACRRRRTRRPRRRVRSPRLCASSTGRSTSPAPHGVRANAQLQRVRQLEVLRRLYVGRERGREHVPWSRSTRTGPRRTSAPRSTARSPSSASCTRACAARRSSHVSAGRRRPRTGTTRPARTPRTRAPRAGTAPPSRAPAASTACARRRRPSPPARSRFSTPRRFGASAMPPPCAASTCSHSPRSSARSAKSSSGSNAPVAVDPAAAMIPITRRSPLAPSSVRRTLSGGQAMPRIHRRRDAPALAPPITRSVRATE